MPVQTYAPYAYDAVMVFVEAIAKLEQRHHLPEEPALCARQTLLVGRFLHFYFFFCFAIHQRFCLCKKVREQFFVVITDWVV